MKPLLKETRAREKDKISEDLYESIMDGITSGVWVADRNNAIYYANKAMEMIAGVTQQKLIGSTVFPQGAELPTKEFRPHYDEAQKTLRPVYYSGVSIRTPAGRQTYQSGWLIPKVKNGSYDGMICTVEDITNEKQTRKALRESEAKYRQLVGDLEERVRLGTLRLSIANEELQQEIVERKWMEQSLRKSEEKYRLVVEYANEGILITQDNYFQYVNPKAVKIWGHPKEELLSRPFTDFIHPDDGEMVTERHLKRIKGDSVPHYYSCRILDGEGNTKWLEINSVLITWMGRPATLAFFNNITERKKAEEKLRLTESAIQQAGDAVVITTANPGPTSSRVVFVNPAFTKMTGYTAEEVTDKLSFFQGPLTDSPQWNKLETGSSQNKAFYLETVATRKDGTQFNMEWQITPLRDERGKVTHFVSVQRDITERKKTEEQFHAYQEQLRLLASELLLAEERERRRIAMDLHDNIGQLLALTRIKLGVLRNTLSGDAHEDAVGGIIELIDQSIGYTKSLSFELSPPLLYDIGIEATIEWLAEQMQKQHYILFYCENDGSPKPLKRDVSILLFQTVRELFMNIVKHSQAHQVNIGISREAEDIMIVVEDDGIGFDASKIDTDLTFGFFSIRERLKYLGGSLSIDTGPGRGTRVTVTSPLDREENAEGVGT